MILAGALTQIIPASANTNGNSANEFYISVSGSDENDGTTHDKAVRTVKKAIELINAAGLVEDDTATVYVDSTVDGKLLTAVETMNDVVSYYNNEDNNKLPLYACTVTFTSYNTDEGGNGSDYLGYGHTNDVSNSFCSLAGPTVFENITLLDVTGREDNYWINYFNARGNTVIFRSVKWSYIEGNNWGYKTGVKKIINDKNKWTQENIFYAGNQYNNAAAAALERTSSQTVAFEGDDGYNLPKIFAFGNSSPKDEFKRSFAGDSTFIWGIKDKALNSAYLTNAKGTAGDAAAFNYNGNVNIVMKNGAKISSIKVSPDESNYLSPKISGAIQIVANAGSEINTADIAAIAKVYTDNNIYAITNGSSDITLDVTDTAGEYSVNGNGVAYIEKNEKIYYSVNGILTVPGVNGLNSYEIKYAKSADEIIGDGTVWQYSGTAGVLIPKQGEKYMLHVKGAIANEYLGLKTASGKITAGTTYTLSFKYRTECGINIFGGDYVRIKLLSGKKALRQTIVQNGSDTNTKTDSPDNNKFDSVVLKDDTMTVTFSLTENETATDDYRIAFVFIPRGSYDKWEYYIKDLKLCAGNSDENILINTGVKADMQGYYADTAEATAGSAVFDYNRTVNGEPTGDKYLAEYVSYYNTNADASFDICDLVAASDIIKSNTNFYTAEDVDLLRYRLLAQ